ncbi:MAG: septum formation protein Maf [Chryseobacterium sp. 39-10]|nr:septum formation protein Maf [Chryseobacterium sp.]OJV46123.1 MAG: septum formation protein Maf [Chryseobacterium sp. 39-10]
MKLLLASNSPRRKELLKNLGIDFEIVAVNCDESYPEQLPTVEIAGYLSQLKADAFRPLQKGEVLLTADTIVVLNNEVLGKPKDLADAKKMLACLSGKTHQVYTGITLKTMDKTITATDVANVEFDVITDSESDYYIENYRPFDKAGSYGIQEWLGMAKIKKIEGSFYTIMGLPTHLVYSLIKDLE